MDEEEGGIEDGGGTESRKVRLEEVMSLLGLMMLAVELASHYCMLAGCFTRWKLSQPDGVSLWKIRNCGYVLHNPAFDYMCVAQKNEGLVKLEWSWNWASVQTSTTFK